MGSGSTSSGSKGRATSSRKRPRPASRAHAGPPLRQAAVEEDETGLQVVALIGRRTWLAPELLVAELGVPEGLVVLQERPEDVPGHGSLIR